MANLVIDAIAAVGVASSTLVNVELTDGRGDPVVGYVTGTDNVIVLPTTVTTDENGEVTIDLIPNADIVPGNTCYTVRIAHKQFLIQKSGATENLFEALVNDPGDLDPINTDFLLKANNLSDVEDPAEARDNLGLGDAATKDVGTVAGTVAAGDDVRFDIAPDHIADPTDAHDATAISFAPTVSIPADDVQEAIEYVMANASGGGGTNDHNVLINRSADNQHPATAVSYDPSASSPLSATQVQGAISELNLNLEAHKSDTVDAHDASAISAVPFATVTATDVQSALQQVYTAAVSGLDEASEISFAPTGDIVATNVQAAIVEVDGELHTHEALATDAHDASAISFVPTAGITSTTAQTAIVEALNDSIAYTDGAAVPKDGSYAATTTSVVKSRVTGNANPRWEVLTDGKHQWGDGTAAADTNLYRSAADTLKTDDQFQAPQVTISGTSTPAAALNFNSLSTTFTPSGAIGSGALIGTTFTATTTGANNINNVIGFAPIVTHSGTGTNANMRSFRSQFSGTNTGVTTTGAHVECLAPQLSGGATIGTMNGFLVNNQGLTGVTNAVGISVLGQTGAGTSSVGIQVGASTTRTLWVSHDANSTTATGGITFGSSADTNLYRSAADTLKTDDSFVVGTAFQVAGNSGFYNTTPIAQPSTTGESAGFTAGAGTTATHLSTFTGNSGTKAYTVSDIVKHLKALGLLASS